MSEENGQKMYTGVKERTMGRASHYESQWVEDRGGGMFKCLESVACEAKTH